MINSYYSRCYTFNLIIFQDSSTFSEKKKKSIWCWITTRKSSLSVWKKRKIPFTCGGLGKEIKNVTKKKGCLSDYMT